MFRVDSETPDGSNNSARASSGKPATRDRMHFDGFPTSGYDYLVDGQPTADWRNNPGKQTLSLFLNAVPRLILLHSYASISTWIQLTFLPPYQPFTWRIVVVRSRKLDFIQYKFLFLSCEFISKEQMEALNIYEYCHIWLSHSDSRLAINHHFYRIPPNVGYCTTITANSKRIYASIFL